MSERVGARGYLVDLSMELVWQLISQRDGHGVAHRSKPRGIGPRQHAEDTVHLSVDGHLTTKAGLQVSLGDNVRSPPPVKTPEDPVGPDRVRCHTAKARKRRRPRRRCGVQRAQSAAGGGHVRGPARYSGGAPVARGCYWRVAAVGGSDCIHPIAWFPGSGGSWRHGSFVFLSWSTPPVMRRISSAASAGLCCGPRLGFAF